MAHQVQRRPRCMLIRVLLLNCERRPYGRSLEYSLRSWWGLKTGICGEETGASVLYSSNVHPGRVVVDDTVAKVLGRHIRSSFGASS